MPPTPANWHGKPYYSLDAYCKNTYGEKLYKIALDAGMTCPNRDGTLGTRGCIFCSAGGSGEFAVPLLSGKGTASSPDAFRPSAAPPLPPPDKLPSIPEMLEKGRRLFGGKKTGQRFIAYFQAYTNTYAPLPYLNGIFRQALGEPSVAGISIATRPDCLDTGVLGLLEELAGRYPGKFIWVELGLQTIHEDTARYIRRGYSLPVFEEAADALRRIRIPSIAHVILGLPGESAGRMFQTIDYLNTQPVHGVKLQLLHVLSGTDLAADYAKGHFEAMTLDEYLTVLIGCIARLAPDIVLHRVTGDGPRELLIAPRFSLDKRLVLNSLHHIMKEQNLWQGVYYHDTRTFDPI